MVVAGKCWPAYKSLEKPRLAMTPGPAAGPRLRPPPPWQRTAEKNTPRCAMRTLIARVASPGELLRSAVPSGLSYRQVSSERGAPQRGRRRLALSHAIVGW